MHASRVLLLRTPVYRNTGSVARDHLASERTFLAWLRTGLGFIALGIAIERFSQLDLTELLTAATASKAPTSGREPRDGGRGNSFRESSSVLVGALLGTGTGCIGYGTTRYFENMRLLEKGFFKPAYYGAGALGVAVAGLAGAVYWSAVRDKNGRGEGEKR
ncbi:hypothetical protein BFW01_g6390 [Lasiodiplodia theobromae]|uniref:DUF202 domain-containing protein n=1 Tax=Lasiodiplodia theobromae TaxID=45133 RepID=A0A5N5CZS4_9PEZI|nr:uncharacterized protein LTHEOB_7752 [Lasiodiplodia theobromae]KAB2570900.1 hypothetical protein DBV05_g10429 [Lasiodiplodia theobromae]KAF4542070.1 hypothetical protein LTHEOB_7752 [Lasiodiplodia theobromae]KAF9635495.1 hypothetical protein BFW01_g6390 [Lasiodiplodia theobromae]